MGKLESENLVKSFGMIMGTFQTEIAPHAMEFITKLCYQHSNYIRPVEDGDDRCPEMAMLSAAATVKTISYIVNAIESETI